MDRLADPEPLDQLLVGSPSVINQHRARDTSGEKGIRKWTPYVYTKHGRKRRKGDQPEDDLLLAVIPILPKADVEHIVNPRASIVGSSSVSARDTVLLPQYCLGGSEVDGFEIQRVRLGGLWVERGGIVVVIWW